MVRKWSSGDLPSYQSRRTYISDLYRPLTDRLLSGSQASRCSRNPQDGWQSIATLGRCAAFWKKHRRPFSTKRSACSVGSSYQPRPECLRLEATSPLDGVAPSQTDGKRMLEAYVTVELSGGTNEAARKHARHRLTLQMIFSIGERQRFAKRPYVLRRRLLS